MCKKILSSICLLLALLSVRLSAQQLSTDPVYQRGSTVLEQTLPPSPEAAARTRYTDAQIGYSEGIAQYDVPFQTLQGREISIPIGLQYSSGGIKLDEIAGVAGLGWTLEAGGCITRTVMDMPDEFSSLLMRHQLPSGALLDSLEAMSGCLQVDTYLRKIVWHEIDSQLDRYTYSFCGLSGSFVISDSGAVVHLGGDGAYITFLRGSDGAPSTFTVTGPDGSKYRFGGVGATETAEHDGSDGRQPDVMTGEQDIWTAKTAWHLTSITSPSGLERAEFSYADAGEWVRDVRSKTEVITDVESIFTDDHVNIESKSHLIRQTYHPLVLSSISLRGYTASFQYASGTSTDLHSIEPVLRQQNFPKRLIGISVRRSDDESLRDSLAVITFRDPNDGRIVLRSLRRYKGGEACDRYDFTYDTRNHGVSLGSRDWFGYYNAEDDLLHNGTICPFVADAQHMREVQHGFPSWGDASYMSLLSADHDGAKTEFEYEGNRVPDGEGGETSIGVRVHSICISDNGAQSLYRNFVYYDPFVDGPARPDISMYLTVGAPSVVDRSMSAIVTWTFSLHEHPASGQNSIEETRVHYGKVSEERSDGPWQRLHREVRAKTVRHFDLTDTHKGTTYTLGRFPASARSRFNTYPPTWIPITGWDGIRKSYPDNGARTGALLTRQEEYSWCADSVSATRDGYTLHSSVDYVYEALPQINEAVLLEYSATQVYRSSGVGNIQPSYVYHYPVYASAKSSRTPVSRLSVTYHPHGNDSLRVAMRYVPRTSLSMPSRLASVESTEGGVTRRLEYTYPDTFRQDDGESSEDEPEPEWARQLASAHRLSTPVGTDWYVHPAGTTPSVPLRRERTEYGTSQIGTRSALLPTLHREYYLGEECWREEIRGRDAWGNVSSVKEKGKPQTLITWGYGGLYPTQITQGTLTTTCTWIPGIGLSSTTSPSGVVTSYEYDHAGRLSTIKDEQGRTLESWEYHLFNDGGDGHLSRRHRTYRSTGTSSGSYGEDITWWNTLGLHQQDNIIGGAGDGRDLVSAFGADALLHDDAMVWLPYPAQTGGFFQESAEDEAAAFHGNSLAYAAKTYEKSARDKVLSEALPGYAGTHETVYSEDVCTTPFPKYVWVETTPATAGVQQQGSYATGEVVVATATDADGRVRSTYTNHAGRILGTSVGDDAPTYYIYDGRDQLRAVAGSGIALSDTLSMWRYSYDALGRLASKGIPGSVRERYTYDDEDRIIETCRGAYVTATDYDELNRPTTVWINGRIAEQHSYTADRETGARLAIIDTDAIGASTPLEYLQKTYAYDSRGRLITTASTYPGGDVLTESTSYNLAGEVTGSSCVYRKGNQTDILQQSFTLDANGRLTESTSALRRPGRTTPLSTATTQYSYDAIGRPCGKTVSTPDGETLSIADTLALQGWLVQRAVTRDGSAFFTQNLRHDESAVSAPGTINIGPSAVPSYTGLVTGRTDTWNYDRFLNYRPEVFYYDYAGRLSEERVMNNATTWTYDQRGNITSSTTSTLRGSTTSGYNYDGDRLLSIATMGSGIRTFTHDRYGRMTRDGLAGTSTVYNCLDRPASITDGLDTTRFVYLADGTKLSVLNTEGEGLAYRGAVVYRQALDSDDEPVLTLESARCPEGRLTSSAALLFVEDHLGSIRAVIDGSDGSVLESSNYSAYGTRSAHSSTVLPSGLTLRERYTGCEDLDPDFLLPYTDHQARLYSSTLSRWMAPDPLSEKYYGISPYAYCGGNPMGAVDPEGNALHVVVGALIGAAVETGIALHQGKTGSELLGAAARGAIDGGFIAATGPGGILKDVAIGALSSAVGSAADQLISTGEIESDKIIRDSAVGGVLGGGGHYVDAIFSKFSKNMIKKIDHYYSDPPVLKSLEKEAKAEVHSSGRSSGKEIQKRKEEKVSTLKEADTRIVESTLDGVDYSIKKTTSAIVSYHMN